MTSSTSAASAPLPGASGPGVALVVGLGMMGASLAGALRQAGWKVKGADSQPDVLHQAQQLGFIDAADDGGHVDVAFVATPVSAVVPVVETLVDRAEVVSDLGSVKALVVDGIDAANFVPGHPMVGSQQSGLNAADVDRFNGATWVLTPSDVMDVNAYSVVRSVVESLGAQVVTMSPVAHDQIVATVSHVPHLLASVLMSGANELGKTNSEMASLAAGGFRDMTRIAAGDAELWADIVLSNADAIDTELTRSVEQLQWLRSAIDNQDAGGLMQFLRDAAQARQELPARVGRPANVATIAIEIPDRPGVLGDIMGVFASSRVNVEDLSMTHDPMVAQGELHITVGAEMVESAAEQLRSAGYRFATEAM